MSHLLKDPRVKSAKSRFVFEGLLAKIVEGKDVLNLPKGRKLFSQGGKADAIYFIKTGTVQVTVTSPQGKKAALAELGPRDFVGEGCLVGDALRPSTATSHTASVVTRIKKQAMLDALRDQPKFSDKFVRALLAHNINLEQDLRDQLFNHSEKRLGRVLLKMSRLGGHEKMPDKKVPRLSHKMLAEIVGTTSAKVGEFMKKFKKLGLIDYKGNGVVTVMAERLTNSVLRD